MGSPREFWQDAVEELLPHKDGRLRCHPTWDTFVPWHSDDCPAYDGKRCMEAGFAVDQFCEPAISAMGRYIKREHEKRHTAAE